LPVGHVGDVDLVAAEILADQRGQPTVVLDEERGASGAHWAKSPLSPRPPLPVSGREGEGRGLQATWCCRIASDPRLLVVEGAAAEAVRAHHVLAAGAAVAEAGVVLAGDLHELRALRRR